MRGWMGARGQFDFGDEDYCDLKSSCKWCDAGNVPELSPYTKTYIHRRDTLDMPCSNPRCPQCGEVATYQTPDGTFWDGNAHSWRARSGDTEGKDTKPTGS